MLLGFPTDVCTAPWLLLANVGVVSATLAIEAGRGGEQPPTTVVEGHDGVADVIEDAIEDGIEVAAGGIRGSGSRDRGPMQQQSVMPARSIGGFSAGFSVSRSRESLSRFRRCSCESSPELAGGRLSWNRNHTADLAS